jgi:adenosylcobinamide-GDP ribazoletransferase
MVWFPVVGLLLGAFLWGAYTGLLLLFPILVAAAVLLALSVLATGGLHLDGLADTLDGLGGGKDRQQSLRIMKDSTLGAFGVIGLILILLLKFALFLALAEKGQSRALLVFPIISRWSMVGLAYLSPYARAEGGLGEAMTDLVTGRHLVFATGLATMLTLLVFSLRGLLALGAVAGFTWLVSLYCRRRLGGITGDILGALNELNEVLVLLITVI